MATVNGRRIGLGPRPAKDSGADAWVRSGNGETVQPSKAELYTARLTIDVTPELRGRIKVVAFQQGMTVAEMLRQLLEREFPEAEQEGSP